MHLKYDGCEVIIKFMAECDTPLTTRQIADGCAMSVYAARYYLQKLSKLHVVGSDRVGKGSAVRWYLQI